MRRVAASRAVFFAASAAAVWIGCAHLAQSQSAGLNTSHAEYADATSCGTCHRQIAESYKLTGMGRSFFSAGSTSGDSDWQEDFSKPEYYHPESDTHFSMQKRGSDVFQRRWQTGLAGKEINVEEMRVDYVMGSGNHARSYLSRTAAGTLIELPLGWFPGNAGEKAGWGMSPGSDTDHPMTRRFVSYKCMFCHNGYPGIPVGNEAPDADPVFSGPMPQGVDCQRCHGPGANHIRTAGRAGAKVAEIRGSIVNPAKLNPALAMDICNQCHLETTSTRLPATLVRFDRGPFSFRPGEPFGNFAISFDHAPGTGHDDKFETVSSVYRLRQSQCFTASAGKLTCQTCHDPHRVPRGEEAVRQYSNVCGQCHSAKTMSAKTSHPAGGDCISCHMPKRRADDIPRMVMTDHFIRRRPPLKLVDLPAPSRKLYQGEVVAYHPSPLPATGENALYKAVAQVGLGNNVEAGLPRLRAEIEKQKPRNPQFYLVLGDTLKATGRQEEAAAAYGAALKLQPNSVRALRSVGTEDALKKALQLAPGDPESWYRYGLLDAEAGRFTEAVDKIRKAIALDPSLPEKSRRLGEILLQAGDVTGAQEAVREALRIDPYDDDAWDLAARLHSQKREVAEAMFAFERSIKLRPGSASHLYDYGLALARAARFEDAQKQAEAAIRADDRLAEAHELLGGLFETIGRAPQAVAEYRRAVTLKPDLSRTQLRLGNMLQGQGDRDGAAERFREAAKSSDTAIAQQAQRALQQLGAQ